MSAESLPVVAAPCCDSCVEAPPKVTTLPVVDPSASRTVDRRITIAGVGVAGAFLAVAVLSAALPAGMRHGLWLPLHLLLAGAASVAIAAVMPFFAAAVTATAPCSGRLRALAVGSLALGIAVAAVGVVNGTWPVAAVGAAIYLLGVAALAVATLDPLRRATNRRRWLLAVAYGVALADLTFGVALVLLYAARIEPVVAAWAQLKPAHAWLNVLGFVSLVITGSLAHLLPTVAGVRITSRRSVGVALAGTAAGPPVVALGFALSADLLTRGGAVIALAGAAALAIFAVQVLPTPSGWTTDRPWHRASTTALALGCAWFVVAVTFAASGVLRAGSSPAAWQPMLVLVPLGIGWVSQALVGAWMHLVPSIGVASPLERARQRIVLATAARTRLLLVNGGCALILLGVMVASDAAVALGFAAVAASVLGSVALLALAVWSGGARAVATRPVPMG